MEGRLALIATQRTRRGAGAPWVLRRTKSVRLRMTGLLWELREFDLWLVAFGIISFRIIRVDAGVDRDWGIW